MFGSSATYPRRSAGILARPRLGPLRSYLRPRNFGTSASASDMPSRSRKGKGRKSNGPHKMDSMKKRTPDYTDIAYREAVSRLRYLLAESYSPHASRSNLHQVHISKVDESGDETEGSIVVSDRSRPIPLTYRVPQYSPKRTTYSDLPRITHTSSTLNVPGATEREGLGSIAKSVDIGQPPPELMAFIERQEEYIEQLEKESQYCRDELSNLLGKVKEVINENEGLHEKEKSGLLKSVFNCFESEDEENQNINDDKVPGRKPRQVKKKRLEGPAIVFESRISELEAQLTQTKIDLRKALEEADLYKRKMNDGQSFSVNEGYSSLPSNTDHTLRQQIESLQREKNELNDNMLKLQIALAQFRDKEADASHKAKRSLDVVDQAQFEKAQSDSEVRRLKDELDRQHEKLRELLQDQGRKLQDERSQVERRYVQQVEQVSADLTLQWELTSKLQLELEKQRRIEAELRRDVQQKSIAVDDLKKELQTKISGLQGEIMQAAAEKGALEQEVSAGRLSIERTERESRQEISRLQAEITALRQRLDRADADVLHSRRENLRLAEQVASLEREVSLSKMVRESAEKNASDGLTTNSPNKSALREQEISSMIHDMEAKHVQTVAELEGMILSQNAVMEKLKDECHALTERLEDSSARHKRERGNYRSENAMLMDKLTQVWENCKELQQQCRINDLMTADSDHFQDTTHTPQTPSPKLNLNQNLSHNMRVRQSESVSTRLSRMKTRNTIPRQTRNQSTSPSYMKNPSTIPYLAENLSSIPNLTKNPSSIPNLTKNPSTIPNLTKNPSTIPSLTKNPSTIPNMTKNHFTNPNPPQNHSMKLIHIKSPSTTTSHNKIPSMRLAGNEIPSTRLENLSMILSPIENPSTRLDHNKSPNTRWTQPVVTNLDQNHDMIDIQNLPTNISPRTNRNDMYLHPLNQYPHNMCPIPHLDIPSPHLLSPKERDLHKPLTLEDLATDSDFSDS